MAHEISDEKFFDTTGLPAWHRLSVFEKLGIEKENRPYTAKEVYKLFGFPKYELRSLYYYANDGKLKTLENDKLIFVQPEIDNDEEKIIGRVSDNYQLIAGDIAATLFDEHIQLPVETGMILKDYGIIVFTAKLPDYEVQGDRITNYLIFANGMNGKIATRADVSSTRVVCANTLAAAQSASIRHFDGAMDILIGWMKDMVRGAIHQTEVMNDVYNILAETSVNREQVQTLAETVYPVPTPPQKDRLYKNGYQKRYESWEKWRETLLKRQQMIIENFQGAAIGFDDHSTAKQGTAWHALNSATEIITHSRTNNFDKRAESLLVGTAKATIEKATALVTSWSPDAMNAMNRQLVLEPAVENN